MQTEHIGEHRDHERQNKTLQRRLTWIFSALAAGIAICITAHAQLPPPSLPPPNLPPLNPSPPIQPPPGVGPRSSPSDFLYGPWLAYPDDSIVIWSCGPAHPSTKRNLDCVWDENISSAQAWHENYVNVFSPDSASSPWFWSDLPAEKRYSTTRTPVMLAHRGLVDLYHGIPENTVAAVVNAIDNGLYMVEIDVQADVAGVPVALHDDWLTRPTGGNKAPIAQSDSRYWAAFNTFIRNPVYLANHYWPPYAVGNASSPGGIGIVSVQDLVTTIGIGSGVTFVWDPKNLAAAQALGRLMMSHPEIARISMMKTYSNYWQTGSDVTTAASNFWSITKGRNAQEIANLRKMKIFPVVNIIHYLDLANDSLTQLHEWDALSYYNEAKEYAKSDAEAWAKNFEIAAVEFPGAFHPLWLPFITTSSGIAEMKSWNFPWNPVVSQPTQRIAPAMIAAGYRFEDFSIYGMAYDWDMHGEAKLDTGNVGRRTVCGQLPNYGTVAKFVTVDFPLQEAWCVQYSLSDDGTTAWGNPQTRFNTYGSGPYMLFTEELEPDLNVPDGDQGGP